MSVSVWVSSLCGLVFAEVLDFSGARVSSSVIRHPVLVLGTVLRSRREASTLNC